MCLFGSSQQYIKTKKLKDENIILTEINFTLIDQATKISKVANKWIKSMK